MSRDLELLYPPLHVLALQHQANCRERRNIDIFFTYTGRTPAEQTALYAQGRRPLTEVNALRHVAGMPGITEKENARTVTNTMASYHLLRPCPVLLPDGGTTYRPCAIAYDVAIRDGNGCLWDTKFDADHDGVPEWAEVAEEGRLLGLVCGWDWPGKKQDPAHFQWKENIA